MWEPDEPDADAFRQWVREAWERFRPFSTGGNYINFQTADEGEERVRATYGANFDRLVEVKQTYDPDNLFRVEPQHQSRHNEARRIRRRWCGSRSPRDFPVEREAGFDYITKPPNWLEFSPDLVDIPELEQTSRRSRGTRCGCGCGSPGVSRSCT